MLYEDIKKMLIKSSEGTEIIKLDNDWWLRKWIVSNPKIKSLKSGRITFIDNGFIEIEQLKELLKVINQILGVTPKEILCNKLTNNGFDIGKAIKLLPYNESENDYFKQIQITKNDLKKYLSSNPTKKVSFHSPLKWD